MSMSKKNNTKRSTNNTVEIYLDIENELKHQLVFMKSFLKRKNQNPLYIERRLKNYNTLY